MDPEMPPASTSAAEGAAPGHAGAGSESSSTDAPAVLVLPTAQTHDLVYCCKRCRRPLFTPDNLTDHDTGKHVFAYRRQAKERTHASSAGAGDDVAASACCTSFFLQDALQWMEEASSDVEGKLTCPKCHVRVGTLKWAGNQCSCGTWVTPALQIYRKAVDERYFPKGSLSSSLQKSEGGREPEHDDGSGADRAPAAVSDVERRPAR